MNKKFAALALALCLPLSAHADEAAQRARAQELITLLHSERMVSQVSTNIRTQASAAAEKLTGPNPTPESKARMNEFEKKISGIIDAQLNWTSMGPEIVNIYAKSFTEDELTAIVAFYKSPAGTAFLAKAPEINTQLNQVAQPRLSALQTQVGQAFEEFRNSQAAPGGPPTLNSLPPATGASPATSPRSVPSLTPPAPVKK